MQQIDAYAITKLDVNVPDRFIKIDPSDFIVNAGLGKTYKPNDNLTDAFLKLYIPYVKCLYKYDKVLYVDLDV